YATVAKLPELLPPARLVPVTKTVAPLRLAAIAVGTSSPLRGPLYVATQSSPLLVCADAPDEEIVSSIAAARQTAEPPQSHSRGVRTAVRGLIGPTPFARPHRFRASSHRCANPASGKSGGRSPRQSPRMAAAIEASISQATD